MKKTLLTALLLPFILFLHAQSYDRVFNPWKVDLSLGAAIPQGTGAKGGALFVLEPKYAIVDQFWVGLRIEAAVMARSFVSSDGTVSSTNVSASGSYLATGDFYFTTTTFRPFVGCGGGVYRLASGSVDDNGYNSAVVSDTKLGGMLRAGFEVGHFRMGVEYNFVGNSTFQTTDYNGNPYSTSSKNSYLGIKAGFVLGGRRLD